MSMAANDAIVNSDFDFFSNDMFGEEILHESLRMHGSPVANSVAGSGSSSESRSGAG